MRCSSPQFHPHPKTRIPLRILLFVGILLVFLLPTATASSVESHFSDPLFDSANTQSPPVINVDTYFLGEGPKPFKNLPGDDEMSTLYLEAESETANPYLSFQADASPVDGFQTETLPEGLDHNSKALANTDEPLAVEFPQISSFDQTRYLNLSKPVHGTVWWKALSSGAPSPLLEVLVGSNHTHDMARIRIELFSGEHFVGGTEFTFHFAMKADPAWIPYHFQFRPEVPLFESGYGLTLKVTRLNGGVGLVLGTGGDHPSYVSFYSYYANPLGSALYVKDKTLLRSAPLESKTTPSSSSSDTAQTSFEEAIVPAGWKMGSLVAAPLFAFILAKRKLPKKPSCGFVGLLFVFLSLSGCLGSDAILPDLETQPHLSSAALATPVYENESSSTLGSLEGQVVEGPIELPVADAHVSIPGTNRFTETDAQGWFRFDNLTPKLYTIRVDAEVENRKMNAEEVVEIQAGKLLRIQVRLAVQGSNIHQHDEWGSEEKLLFQEPFEFAPQFHHILTRTTNKWFCPGTEPCTTPIPIDPSRRILPGTSWVEVLLEWDSGDPLPTEFGLSVATPLDPSVSHQFLPRSSGTPFRIPIFPHEADPGHQQFTRWKFELVFPHTDSLNPIGPLAYVGDAQTNRVKTTIWIHKGVVPFEPAHRDFWNGASEIELLQGEKKRGGCWQLCDYPDSSVVWVPRSGSFVPPGTQEIQGELRWNNPGGLPLPIEWGIAYRPANVPPDQFQFTTAQRVENSDENTYAFVIPVPPEEVDQYYQFASYWTFSPDDLDTTIPNASWKPGFQTEWSLTAKAIRAPDHFNV